MKLARPGASPELARYWTLSPDERELLGNKTGAIRLNFAILLKAFQFEGRFPDRREARLMRPFFGAASNSDKSNNR